MATNIIRDQRIYIDSMELTTAINSVALTTGVDILDETALGDTARMRKSGLYFADIQVDGFFAAGSTGPDASIFADVGARMPVAVTQDAAAEGSIVYFMDATGVEYKPGGTIGDLMKFSFSAQSSSKLSRGTVLNNLARTASGNSTAQLLGAVGATQKLYAAIFTTAVSGTTPSMTVKIQSDDNAGFTTPTDRITFTAQTGANAQFAVPVSGAITDTYWRALWTISGTTPSFTTLIAMAIS